MSHTNQAKSTVELFGLPGAGKSTEAKVLAASGYVHVTDISNRARYVTMTARYPLTIIVWLPLLLSNALAVKRWRVFRYDLALLYTSLYNIHRARRYTTGPAVIDEGLLQRLLSVSYVLHKPWQVRLVLRVSPVGTELRHVNHRDIQKDRYDDDHPRKQVGEKLFAKWRSQLEQNLVTLSAVLRAQ